MNINCAIIDDEPLALDLLESYVNKTPFLTLCGKFSSAVEALGKIKNSGIKLVFVDIQMPDLNGIEFSRALPSDIRIVFITAFSEYALEGFRVNALDYLLKPVSYADFLLTANKALEWFEAQAGKTEEEAKFIYVKSDYKLLRIELDDIIYIEGLKDYVKIHLESSPRPVITLMRVKALEEILPEADFIRVHRSYIVRKDKIKVIERGRIVFGSVYIPVSDSYKDALQTYLNINI